MSKHVEGLSRPRTCVRRRKFPDALKAGMDDPTKGPTVGMFVGALAAVKDQSEENFGHALKPAWEKYCKKNPINASLLRGTLCCQWKAALRAWEVAGGSHFGEENP